MNTPDRHWLFTWTTYGTWLPGDERGFGGNVRDAAGNQVRHNAPGTPYDADIPALEHWSRDKLKGEPVYLGGQEAEALVFQYQETARIKNWVLEAVSVMANHNHFVIGVFGDPKPKLMRDQLKAWATRALKALGPIPENGDWWTTGGSVRKLRHVPSAVIYVVRRQPNPLAVWYRPEWQETLDSFDRNEIKLATGWYDGREPG